jgi:hypothetical protein
LTSVCERFDARQNIRLKRNGNVERLTGMQFFELRDVRAELRQRLGPLRVGTFRPLGGQAGRLRVGRLLGRFDEFFEHGGPRRLIRVGNRSGAGVEIRCRGTITGVPAGSAARFPLKCGLAATSAFPAAAARGSSGFKPYTRVASSAIDLSFWRRAICM